MKYINYVFILLCCVLLSACANTTKVTTDYNKTYPFAEMKTFHILPEMPNGESHGVSLADQRVRQALTTELKAKGLAASDSKDSSIWVSFLVTSKDKTRIRTYNTGLTHGAYSFYRYGGSVWNQQMDVYEYTEGQLIVDFIDPNTNHVVWRGVGTRVIYPSDAERSEDIITSSIQAILETVPGWQSTEE